MFGTKSDKSGRQTGIIAALILAMAMLSMISADIHAQKPAKKIGVFVNRRDKKKTVGYTRVGLVWAQLFSPSRNFLRVPINLKEAMKRYTKIDTDVDDHLELASNDLLKTPIIFLLTEDNVEVTPTELENLKKYIELGGLIIADTHQVEVNAKANAALRKLIKAAIPNARFEPIPNSHELYHCFFDFDDGPPTGTERAGLSGDSLEGVYYKGRLAAVFSEKNYASKWQSASGSEPQLKMAINMIVYSLIQEGGIASVY